MNLEIEPGTFLGLLGPNGTGKTTLFRGILGLIKPMAGRVERHQTRFGYVPQREHLDPLFPVTVEEVVHMGAYGRLSGWRRLSREDREGAQVCLERVGLADQRRKRFASLSGGQRQRALIARALLTRPELLLLDEPTSGVDRPAARRILDLLRELHTGEGLSVLLVSHQLDLVREATEEVLWVSGGNVHRGRSDEMLAPEGLDRLFGLESATGEEAPG